MSKLLLLEDDLSLIDGLTYSLNKAGYEVDVARTVGEALERLSKPDCFALLLLDVTLPDGTGFSVCEQVREKGSTVPIIFLTARVAEEDAVAGYGLGADDYVRKPFGAAELRAKVAAHLRRERRPRSHALSFGEVRIDLGARGLAVGGEAVPLTPTEYAICEYLARHPGQVMSRAQIREAVLGWESDADDAAISMQVSRARRKLSEAGADPIATVWGMGYKWQP